MVIDLLREHGADRAPHAGGRTLLEHLVETREILRRWRAPEWLECAALIHSVYGTDAYADRLIPLSAREQVASVAGETAERLAYLFCMTPRGPLLAGTRHWSPDLPLRDVGDPLSRTPLTPTPPTRAELDALVLLHMANLAEQARAADGSPGRWVTRCAEVATLIDRDGVVAPPPFARSVAGLTEQGEALARRTYRAAIGRPDDSGEDESVCAGCRRVSRPRRAVRVARAHGACRGRRRDVAGVARGGARPPARPRNRVGQAAGL